VDQAVNAPKVDEQTVMGDVADNPLEDGVFFEGFKGLFPQGFLSASKAARRERTTFPWRLSYLTILKSCSFPTRLPKSLTGLRSA